MGDLIKPAGQWIAEHVPLSIGIALFIFCLLFEVSKVKVYPLKWLWKAISFPLRKIDEQRTQSFKAIAGDIKADIDNQLKNLQNSTLNNCALSQQQFEKFEARFDELDKRIDVLDKKNEETEERLDKLAAARIKNHVFNFAQQCRKGELHSKEAFASLFKENIEYNLLVKKYNWVNDVYKHDFAYIEHVYDECNLTNKFSGE